MSKAQELSEMAVGPAWTKMLEVHCLICWETHLHSSVGPPIVFVSLQDTACYFSVPSAILRKKVPVL